MPLSSTAVNQSMHPQTSIAHFYASLTSRRDSKFARLFCRQHLEPPHWKTLFFQKHGKKPALFLLTRRDGIVRSVL